MVGDPADSIIADEYTFGAHNFDTKQALTDMLTQATTVNDVRPGEALEQQYGYLPEDGTYGCCNAHGFMSTLLEYDNEDLALAQFASDMGDTSARGDADALGRTTGRTCSTPNNNLLTLATGERPVRARRDPDVHRHVPHATASHMSRATPTSTCGTFPTTTRHCSRCWAATAKVRPMLEQYLSKPNGCGMYAQLTNEFDFGEQFALDYAGDPAGTQKAVANIRNTMYLPGPDGLANNDDLGANSSSFVWEMLGMYPENSGRGTLVFASPGFPKETIHLGNGKTDQHQRARAHRPAPTT